MASRGAGFVFGCAVLAAWSAAPSARADEPASQSEAWGWISAGGAYGLPGMAPFVLEAGLLVNFGSHYIDGSGYAHGFEINYLGMFGTPITPSSSDNRAAAAARGALMPFNEIRLWPRVGLGWGSQQQPTAENGGQYRLSSNELRFAVVGRLAESEYALGGTLHFTRFVTTSMGGSGWSADLLAMFGSDSSKYLEASVDAGQFDLANTPGRLVLWPRIRDRGEDVLTPAHLAARHRAYHFRLVIGPTYRADAWAALDREPDLSPADLARRAYTSFATAWQVRRDFQLVNRGSIRAS